MNQPSDSPVMHWRKSSRSQEHGACVELARLRGGVAVRDSKNPDGGFLAVTAEGFADLLVRVKRGELTG